MPDKPRAAAVDQKSGTLSSELTRMIEVDAGKAGIFFLVVGSKSLREAEGGYTQDRKLKSVSVSGTCHSVP